MNLKSAARAATVAVAAAATTAALGISSPAAHAASTTDCGYADDNISSITTDYFDDGTFKIHVTPKFQGRINGAATTNDMWHAVQGCVPGLYDSLADSIYQQLQCHTWFGDAWFATGPSYDLESWRVPLADPGVTSYVSSHCLNDQPSTIQDDPYANIA